MRNSLKMAFYTLLIVLFFSCDEIESLADIDFPVTLTKSHPFEVTTTDEMTTTIVLDATTNSEVKKYVNNIKSYRVTELLFAIENYAAESQDDIFFDGVMGVSKKSENQPSSTCQVNDLNITQKAKEGNFEITNCSDVVNKMSSLLKQENAINIYLIGEFTKAPLEFDLKVTATVTVTANPL